MGALVHTAETAADFQSREGLIKRLLKSYNKRTFLGVSGHGGHY